METHRTSSGLCIQHIPGGNCVTILNEQGIVGIDRILITEVQWRELCQYTLYANQVTDNHKGIDIHKVKVGQKG